MFWDQRDFDGRPTCHLPRRLCIKPRWSRCDEPSVWPDIDTISGRSYPPLRVSLVSAPETEMGGLVVATIFLGCSGRQHHLHLMALIQRLSYPPRHIRVRQKRSHTMLLGCLPRLFPHSYVTLGQNAKSRQYPHISHISLEYEVTRIHSGTEHDSSNCLTMTSSMTYHPDASNSGQQKLSLGASGQNPSKATRHHLPRVCSTNAPSRNS